MAAACTPPAAPRTPWPAGGAPHPTASPAPTPTIIPTQVVWPGWNASGVNLALKKRVKVSRETYGFGGPAAVDGSLRTRWNSGAGPTQWIEIDLGQAYDIAEIRLLPASDNPGVTVHRVLGRAPFVDEYRLLHTFESQVSDSPLLALPSPGPWRNIQFVRIETTFSPVPVGWREIMIIEAE